MKQIITIFLFVVAMVSCQPKCDCTKCAEECKVTSTVEQVETPTADTLVQETKEEVIK